MARVEHLKEKEVHRVAVHQSVDASFHVFELDGVEYLQIDPYGSAGRQIAGKVSQSIQFGPEGISQLRSILVRMK